jgi:predicted amidohydrolase YtcJ
MTCNPLQWEIATALDRTGELTLNVLEYFDAEDPEDFEEVLQQAIEARSTQTAHVRLGGVKVYLDGALGSEGAYISQHYQNGKGGRGFTLMDETRLKEIMAIAFMENMPLALHVIGDEAGHRAILTYLEIEKELGLHGELHLEHAQMLRPESISLMKEKNIICHLQPCHWLSDKRWLKEKLGLLFSTIFPWALLEHAGVKFDFGSDSPIEIPSLGNNQKAVNELMLEGIPKPEKAFSLYHQQRVDTNNTLSTYTDWGEDGSISVCFEGKLLSL